MLASDEPPELAELELRSIEYDLNIISAQDQLPECILDAYGFERSNMRPFTARELIELYISEDNAESDQVDYKKALDLVEYIAPLGIFLSSTILTPYLNSNRVNFTLNTFFVICKEAIFTSISNYPY